MSDFGHGCEFLKTIRAVFCQLALFEACVCGRPYRQTDIKRDRHTDRHIVTAHTSKKYEIYS